MSIESSKYVWAGTSSEVYRLTIIPIERLEHEASEGAVTTGLKTTTVLRNFECGSLSIVFLNSCTLYSQSLFCLMFGYTLVGT